jgi:hypothetical protein
MFCFQAGHELTNSVAIATLFSNCSRLITRSF